jgi:hypothetical protein
MLKSWLYYIIDKNGNSYRVNNDVVETTSTPTPLENTPDGWQDISIGYDRDLKKLGIVRSFTLPLSFIRNVSRILRTVLFTTNIEEQLFLLIQKLSVTVESGVYRFLYQYFYKGQLDLLSYRYEEGVKDVVLVDEAGIFRQIKANENTVYPISLNDPEAITVKMDGVFLQEKHYWIIPSTSGVASGNRIVGTQFVQKEGMAFGFASFSVFEKTEPTLSSSSDYFIAATQDITGVRIHGSLGITSSDPWQLNIKDQTGAVRANLIDITTVSQNNQVHDFDVTIDLNEGDRLFLCGGSSIVAAWIEGEIRAEFQSRYKTTYRKFLKLSTLLKRLIGKITGSENNCDTTFLEEYDNFLIGSGDGLRGFEDADIKTSLSQFGDFARVVLPAGQGIENGKYSFNSYEHYFATTDPIDLGDISGLRVMPTADLICNTLKIGYPPQQIDNVNGRYSFNNTILYTLPVTLDEPKELALISPYISDPFYQEIIRINFEGRTSTDDKSDNSVFVVNVDLPEEQTYIADFGNFLTGGAIVFYDGAADEDLYLPGSIIQITGPTTTNTGQFTVVATITQGSDILVFTEEPTNVETGQEVTINAATAILHRETYDSITGVPDGDSLYNIEGLTPRRLVDKHYKYINSILTGLQGKKVKWVSTDKNADLVTVLAGTETKEKSDYNITTDKLFKYFYFEFDTQVPINLVETLEENAYRPFQFTWDDVDYIGFLVKAGIAANDYKPQSYKLLCAPDNDLTTLI